MERTIPRLATRLAGDGNVWRVELTGEDRREALRDYCLRLGASAELDEAGTIEASFPHHIEDDLEPYLRSWLTLNQIQAALRPRTGRDPVGGSGRLRAAAGAPKESAPEVETTMVAKPPRLGEILVKRGLITAEQLAEALFESRHTDELLGRVLLTRGWVFEEELARTLADQWDVPYLSLMRIGVNPRAVDLLPHEVGLRFAAIPVRFDGDRVVVAFADPSDQGALDAVRMYLPSIMPAVADLSDITMVWRKILGSQSSHAA